MEKQIKKIKKLEKNIVISRSKSGAIELRGDFSKEAIRKFRIVQKEGELSAR